MDTRLWLMGGGWLLVIASCLLVPSFCSAQLLLRPGLRGADSPENSQASAGPEPVANGNAGPPATNAVKPAADEAQASDDDTLISQYVVAAAGPVGPRKWFSETKLAAYVRAGVTYDDNILLSSIGPRHSDVITTLVGGARLSLGDFTDRVRTFAIIGYTGTGEIFAKNGGEDDYNQDALVDLYYRQHLFAVGSTSVFQELHDETADLGQRVGRRVYGEDFTVKYYRNDFTTLSSEIHFEHDDYDTPIDTTNLTAGLALDYAVTGKVTLGAGFVWGRLTATDGVAEFSEQGQLRLGYIVTHKVTAAASIGVEYRQRGSGASDSVTPVFAITGKWTPFNGTAIALSAHRQTQASGALNGEDFFDTGVQLGVRQDLFQRIYVRLDLGYQNADYDNVTGKGSTVPRNDNYVSVRGTVGYDFVEWLQMLAFYERRQDDSTRSNFSFTSNRVGMEVSLTY